MNIPPLLSVNRQKLLCKTHQKKYREQLGLYFGEGYRLLIAALNSNNAPIGEIVLSDRTIDSEQGGYILRTAGERKIPLYRTSERNMQKLSAEVTPPGIFFTIEKKSLQADLHNLNDQVVVFLERISEAGNLGTILRNMVWFGIRSLILSPGCVDLYNPKTVRASAGAIFEIYVYPEVQLQQAITLLKPKGYVIAAAVPEGGQPVVDIKKIRPLLLVFGSEADGLSPIHLQRVDSCITIPRLGTIDSLNLAMATGIIFYQISV
jgi:RNA methyltransferase, TrmH family